MINIVKKSILETITPSFCTCCGKNGIYICKNCLKNKLKVNFKNICHVCGQESFVSNLHKECIDSTNLDNLYFFCEYNTYSKKIIENIKYMNNFAITQEVTLNMAKFLKVVAKSYLNTNPIITYVPSFWKKENVRGFNQSKLLASGLAKILNLECRQLLCKITSTKKQAGANKLLRQQNLNNVFNPINKSDLRIDNVLIIDDVHTTGATLNQCASVLKSLGVNSIYGFTFAKSLNYSHGKD